MTLSTNRRKMLLGLVSATTAATGAGAYVPPQPAPSYDPIPEWWDQFKLATKEFCTASHKPGNGDFDTPEMIEIEDRRCALEQKIANATPKTMKGAAAQIEFVSRELNEGIIWDQHGPILDRLAQTLRGIEQ